MNRDATFGLWFAVLTVALLLFVVIREYDYREREQLIREHERAVQPRPDTPPATPDDDWRKKYPRWPLLNPVTPRQEK